MTACPVCGSEDVRVRWPEGQTARREPCIIGGVKLDSLALLVPLTCKKCSHKWSVRYLPPKTEGERLDQEAATA